MFCFKCNAQLSDEAIFCPYCGVRLKGEAKEFTVKKEKTPRDDFADVYSENSEKGDGGYTSTTQSFNADSGNYGDYRTEYSEPVPQKTMKWFKFLIYFSLFAGALASLYMAIIYYTGAVYISAEGTVIAETVYSVFPTLKTVDLIYAVYYVGMAVFMVVTRFMLSGFKKIAPRLVVLIYVIQAFSYIAYVGMVIFAVEGSGLVNVADIVDVSSIGSTVVTSIIMAVANHVYFKKRAYLFVN